MKFPERLKILREDSGFTQKHLYKVLNITLSTISHYENGTKEQSVAILIKIAKALGVSVDHLAGSADVNILPKKMNKLYCKKISTGRSLSVLFNLIQVTDQGWGIY